MPEHSNEMRFALFKNDKGGNDKRPDYRGTIQLNGVTYDLSAWIKTSKKGERYMSGEVSTPKERRASPETAQAGFAEAKAAAAATEDADVPF